VISCKPNCAADKLCDNCKARILLGELVAFTKAVCERLSEDEVGDALEVCEVLEKPLDVAERELCAQLGEPHV